MGLMGIIQRHYRLRCAIKPGFAASHLPPMTHLWDFIAALLAFGRMPGYCYSGCWVICFPFLLV